MDRAIRKSIVAVFSIMMISILLLIVFCFEDTVFSCKPAFSISQSIMLLIGVMTLFLLGIGFRSVEIFRGVLA